DPSLFQTRPSPTGDNPAGTAFSNLGPNSKALRDAIATNAAAYLERERPYNAGLTRGAIPADAVQTSASGVDPQISVANARIQAGRVAARTGLPKARVLALVKANTDNRALGILGEAGVNVLDLNLAIRGARR
ncbi:MAG: potassium-transporting ATPase KdpC subunit, partial [Solirubrobacteraceae bacterium]|nr:potassium-transporting ATPase KdpC subunit [Solirubrobacteraceae bacterium]